MNILFLTPFYAPYWEYGGSVRSVYSLVEYISVSNDVTVLTTTIGDYWEQSSINANSHSMVIRYFKAISSFRFSVKYLYHALKNIKKVDIVYINGLWSWPSVLGVIISCVYSKNVILAPRGMLLAPALSKKSFVKKICILIYKITFSGRRTAVHWTSNFELSNSGLQFKNSQNLVCPNNISEDIVWRNTGPLPSSSSLTIVFMGRLDPIKNVDNIIDAVLMINRSGRKVKLNIIGDGNLEYVNYLKKLASPCPYIRFYGHLDSQARIDVIDDSHVGILVSKSENFGLAAAEFLIRGRPVILGPNVAIKEFVDSSIACWICEESPAAINSVLLDILFILDGPGLSAHSCAAVELAHQYFKPDITGSIFNHFTGKE